MKIRLSSFAALAVLVAALVIGCASEPEPKPDSGAPPVSYKMVPATTGGGTAPTESAAPAPVTTPTAATGNPASPGSD